MIEQIRRATRFGFQKSVLRIQNPGTEPLMGISSFFTMAKAAAAGFFVMMILSLAMPVAAQTAPSDGVGISDAIIADPNSGTALFGYDPVAYFIDGRASVGDPAINAIVQGFVWRFVNEGNREAFIADPAAYIPAYGGYDPLDVAAERLVAGRPQLFAVVDQRLMFFRNEATRETFLAKPALRAEAAAKWPVVSRGLTSARP